MREGFVTFVQGMLVRVKCRVKDIYNFTQADFTLEGDRVKTRCLFDYLPVYVVIELLIIDVPNMFTKGGICPPVLMCERTIVCPVSLLEVLSPSNIKDTGAIYWNVVLIKCDHFSTIDHIFM